MTEREKILFALEKARTYQDENYDIWYNADDVEKAMKEYAEQRIREELISYNDWYYSLTTLNIFHKTDEELIDEYLNQRKK